MEKHIKRGQIMTTKNRFNQKSKVKSDVKFDTNDLIDVVVGIFLDAHGVVIFRDSGVDIITETKELRLLIEKAFEGRILKSKEENINTFYQ